MSAVYDRRVSATFLRHFDEQDDSGGGLASLVAYARSARHPVDLQFRHGGGVDWATLYVGLTSVLDVRASKKGLLRLTVHETHASNGGFNDEWRTSVEPQVLYERWPEVEHYLDRVIPHATLSHGRKEGAVQAALSSYASTERVVFDRETTPSFSSTPERQATLIECARPVLEALHSATLDFGGVPKKLGNECDALGVDADGRLLAVEVKPQGVGSVAFVAAQALMYARITQAWVRDVGDDEAVAVVDAMVAQRARVGLTASSLRLSAPVRVVPVVALQRGSSPEMVRRMLAVRDVLAGIDPAVEPIEIYEVTLLGDLVPLDESRLPDGRPRTRDFAASMNRRMIAWKQDPASPLPPEARAHGLVRSRSGAEVAVDYALPAQHAEHNLLPDVRDTVLDLFRADDIAWHQGTPAGPTPHLRSSQVQCLNALGAMVHDPDRIARAFGPVLDIGRVRDLGTVDRREEGRSLTFEFTGPHNYFGEAKGAGTPPRGSHSTSLDAAFAYVTAGGRPALALVEWKFTERYRGPDATADRRLVERTRRYEADLRAPDGPVRLDDVPALAVLFHEPIYQLVRQQLLAHRLRQDPTIDADVVRVVHVSPRENLAYQRSFIHPSLRQRGSTVSEVWRTLLRDSDTFVELDSESFLDAALTGDDYVQRYGPRGGAARGTDVDSDSRLPA